MLLALVRSDRKARARAPLPNKPVTSPDLNTDRGLSIGTHLASRPVDIRRVTNVV